MHITKSLLCNLLQSKFAITVDRFKLLYCLDPNNHSVIYSLHILDYYQYISNTKSRIITCDDKLSIITCFDYLIGSVRLEY